MSWPALLELNKISKTFTSKDGESIQAVKNVSLSLKHGECLSIVGESGCGKSTLARIICFLNKPDSGNIIFKGDDITRLKGKALKNHYQNIQMIFQDPLASFSPRMKIDQFLIEPFIIFRLVSKKNALNKAKEMLQQVGLTEHMLNRYPGELSGGQLQRVVITRAINLMPEIIVSDESTSALDVSVQKQIIELLQKLRQEYSFSMIFITHDLAVAENISERILVMKEGEILEQLNSYNIKKEANHPYTKKLIDSVFQF